MNPNTSLTITETLESKIANSIDQLAYQCHQNAVLHGFYNPEPSYEQRCLLQISEIMERYQGFLYEKGDHINEDPRNLVKLAQIQGIIDSFEAERNYGIVKPNQNKLSSPDEHCPEFNNEEIETADLIIRVLDFAAYRNLRIGEAIIAKHTFNKTRPYKHNKAF